MALQGPSAADQIRMKNQPITRHSRRSWLSTFTVWKATRWSSRLPYLYPWMMTLVGWDTLKYVLLRDSWLNSCAQSTFLLVSSRYWTRSFSLCCRYCCQVVLFRSAHSIFSSTPVGTWCVESEFKNDLFLGLGLGYCFHTWTFWIKWLKIHIYEIWYSYDLICSFVLIKRWKNTLKKAKSSERANLPRPRDVKQAARTQRRIHLCPQSIFELTKRRMWRLAACELTAA